MKRPGSSLQGKQTTVKRNGTSAVFKVRFVKFTPEEMAYEAPADVSDPKRFVVVGRGGRKLKAPVFQGLEQWKQFKQWKRNVAVLEPKVRKLYPTDADVNEALLKLAEAASHVTGRRKIA